MQKSRLALVADRDDIEMDVPASVAEATPQRSETAPVDDHEAPAASPPSLTGDGDWFGFVSSWAVRLLSLAVGVLLWHLACAYKINFFINFENVPARSRCLRLSSGI